MGGQCAKAQVVGRRIHSPVQRQGAQPLGDRQPHPRSGEFVGKEVVVELRVVGDQDAVLKHGPDLSGDLLEGRGALQSLGGQPMYMHRPGVAAGVEQG